MLSSSTNQRNASAPLRKPSPPPLVKYHGKALSYPLHAAMLLVMNLECKRTGKLLSGLGSFLWLPRTHHPLFLSLFTVPACNYSTSLLFFFPLLFLKERKCQSWYFSLRYITFFKMGFLLAKHMRLYIKERGSRTTCGACGLSLPVPPITMDTIFKAGAYLDSNKLARKHEIAFVLIIISNNPKGDGALCSELNVNQKC